MEKQPDIDDFLQKEGGTVSIKYHRDIDTFTLGGRLAFKLAPVSSAAARASFFLHLQIRPIKFRTFADCGLYDGARTICS